MNKPKPLRLRIRRIIDLYSGLPIPIEMKDGDLWVEGQKIPEDDIDRVEGVLDKVLKVFTAGYKRGSEEAMGFVVMNMVAADVDMELIKWSTGLNEEQIAGMSNKSFLTPENNPLETAK